MKAEALVVELLSVGNLERGDISRKRSFFVLFFQMSHL